ncbi:MAG: hypothetical protein C0407_02615 [Desulfobacca sp.]|nr:hypothetical protein [Desulfobacca sp.]
MKRTRPKGSWIMVGLACYLFISGCGYGFRGGTNNLPTDIQSVYLPVFLNATSEPGVEVVFTNTLIYEFTRSRMLKVVPESSAQAVVQGKIKRVIVDPVVYGSQTQALDRKVTVDLEVSCRRLDNQKILWQNQNLSRFEVFTVTTDLTQTDRNKQEAINKIAKNLSEQIHNGILENF